MIPKIEVVSRDGDVWRQIACVVGDKRFVIKGHDDQRFDTSLPAAMGVINDAEDFCSKLGTFLDIESKTPQLRGFSDEINALKLESVCYWSSKKPNEAEVVFEENKSGHVWACLYCNGVFSSLSLSR